MNKIAIILPYFGKWPDWIDLFIYSCEKNRDIDFIIYTDCPYTNEHAANVVFHFLKFSDYCNKTSHILNIDFYPDNPYKLCDLKPFYGIVHEDDLTGYDFWGFGDIDVVWGNILKFYTTDLFENYDVFSTHNDRLSGHLAILRNNRKYRNLCLEINEWQTKLESKTNFALDETDFSTLIFPESKIIRRFYSRFLMKVLGWKFAWTFYITVFPIIHFVLNMRKRRLFFVEQHTTPILSSDGKLTKMESETWKYFDGAIINGTTLKEHMYLHFMVYKKNNTKKKYFWEYDFYNVNKNEISQGVFISKKGLFNLRNSRVIN